MSNKKNTNVNPEDLNVTEAPEVLTDGVATTDGKLVSSVEGTDTATEEAEDDGFLKKALEQVAKPEQTTLSSLMGMSAFKAFRNIPNVKGGSGIPSIGIVYTPRNGKRLSISNALFDLLGQPKQLAIAFTDTQLALGSELPMDAQKYPFSPDKYAHIIYRSAVVQEIIKQFGLDFGGISSKSFTDVRMDSFTNALGVVVPVAIVTMK